MAGDICCWSIGGRHFFFWALFRYIGDGIEVLKSREKRDPYDKDEARDPFLFDERFERVFLIERRRED